MSENNQMSGAEAVIKALVENGVEVIFGYPGGAVLPLYDALFKNKKRGYASFFSSVYTYLSLRG